MNAAQSSQHGYEIAALMETCPLGPVRIRSSPISTERIQRQSFSQYPKPNSFTVGDGFDFQGYTFASPLPANLNAYVAKIDYNITASGNHRLFVRGVLNNDRNAERSSMDPNSVTGDGGAQFPGRAAARPIT